MNVLKHIEIVEEFLTKYPKLRDDDNRLIANIWHKYLCSKDLVPKDLKTTEFLKLYSEGDIPSPTSITRCRRKIQEENPDLRGKVWDKRHKIAEEISKDIVQHRLIGV